MRHLLRIFSVAVLFSFVGATAAAAQRRPIELGLDALFAWHNPDGPTHHSYLVDGPMGGSALPTAMNGLRAGFSIHNLVTLEPSLGYNLFSQNDETLSRFGFSTSILLHRSAAIEGPVPFVGIGGSFTAFDYAKDSGCGSEFDSICKQFGAHSFVGVNVPVVDRLALRVAVGGGRFFENDDFDASWTAFGSVGMSFWPGNSGTIVASR
jgi:hypothetical protein